MSISAIVATHRAGDGLRRAVASIAGQTVPPSEIVVVANGSLDPFEVRHIVGEPAVVAHEPRVGAAFARNCGLRVARGSICAFLDSDDEWAPNYLHRLSEALARVPDAALYVGGAITRFSDRTRVLRPPVSRLLTMKALVRRNVISTSSAAVRRDSALAVGGFSEGLRMPAGCEDLGLWLKLAGTSHLTTVSGAYCLRDEQEQRERTSGSEDFYRDLYEVLLGAVHSETGVQRRVAEAAIWLHRATVLLKGGEPLAAHRCAREACRLDPANVYAWAWMARITVACARRPAGSA